MSFKHRRFTNFYTWLVEREQKEDELLLNEGLTKSFPVDSLIQDISRRYKNIQYNQKDGTFTVENIPLRHKEALKRKLDSYGYFIANEMKHDNVPNIFSILVEPKFPTEIPYFYLHDKIRYCYHITSDKYIEKIKKIGLVPKQSNRKFYQTSGNRIYFLISDDPRNDIPLLKSMIVSDDKRKEILKQPKKYYLLRINFHELNNDIVFYRDPRLIPEGPFKGQGIFTLRNIPPDKLEFLGEV